MWRSGVARGGGRGRTTATKKFSKKAKSVEKLEEGVHVTCSKLKLIKCVSTEENDEELDTGGC